MLGKNCARPSPRLHAVRGVSKDIVRASTCWIKDPALLAMVVRWTLGALNMLGL